MSNDTKVVQSFGRIVKNNARMFMKVARLTPEYIVGMIAEGMVYGLINFSGLFFMNELFNAFDKGMTFGEIALILGIMSLFYAVSHGFAAWYWKYFNPVVKKKLEYKLHREIYEKAIRADLASYDDPEYYNDFIMSMEKAQQNAFDIVENVGKLISRFISIGGVVTIVASIDPISLWLLIGAAAVQTVAGYISGIIEYKQEKENTPLYRRKDYVCRVFRLPDNSKELRISKMSEKLSEVHADAYDDILKSRIKYGKKYFLLWSVLVELAGNASKLIIMLRMLRLISIGKVLLGGFAAAIHATWRFMWILSDFLERFTKFPKFSLLAEQYFTFVSSEPKMKSGDAHVDEFESLELRNVSFTYDFSNHTRFEDIKLDTSASYRKKKAKEAAEGKSTDADKKKKAPSEALKNVSFKIGKGEKCALVGYNGAGKTTLIKLIMRLYDPTEGVILYNGRDIREYDIEEYRRHISVIFQDYKIFAATVAENVLCRCVEDGDREKITNALERMTFGEKLRSLKNGIDTVLTREFDKDGTELSGGESQKVALARALVSDAELLIMDEPSSALDPKAEYALNKALLDSTEGRTVIFISHRLSTTTIADNIYMFDGGRLAESGTHRELLDANGAYAEMFALQAEKYRSI